MVIVNARASLRSVAPPGPTAHLPVLLGALSNVIFKRYGHREHYAQDGEDDFSELDGVGVELHIFLEGYCVVKGGVVHGKRRGALGSGCL